MKLICCAMLCCIISGSLYAQLTVPVHGGNKKAWTGERIGLTDITITYNRPGVKGRDGRIWGTVVPEGFFKPDFTNNAGTPWRAGANENTTISFSNPVKVEGKELPEGKYGFFIAYGPEESTVIFSKNFGSWGSYFYNEKEDALRVKVKPRPATEHTEWLTYRFMDQTDSTATIEVVWEKLIIPFRVQANLKHDQLESFRQELRTDKGFTWTSFNQAAEWCAQHGVNINEALLWADSATSPLFGGDKQFIAWATKAQLLEVAGRPDEAAAVMQKALPLGTVQDIHQYGRQLLAAGRKTQALDVFKLNAQKHPKQFTTYVGLARGYSANGNYTSALKNAELALPLAPDAVNKASVEEAIKKLKEKKDFN